jgi:prepilin-type N-terminal cleavage/methylation domain-containing protein
MLPFIEDMPLPKSAIRSRTLRGCSRGFSMVEMAISLCVLLILTAIAIPSLMQSFRTYQLNDAAGRISDMLKFTRFEAVRRNKQVCFLMQTSGAGWIIGTDSTGTNSTCSGTLDANGKQQVIAGFATLLPSGAPPSSASITSTLGASSTLTTLSGTAGSVAFDARGAVLPLAAYVLYVGSATDPEFGYRAVILLPSGATQIWTAPTGGPWQRIG